MNADELKAFLEKVVSQLNKKLDALGSKAVVVPGEKNAWDINCLTPRGLYVCTYFFTAGQPWYKPDGEHELFMKMPPDNNYMAFAKTDASQSPLVASRRLATKLFDHLIENESRPMPSVNTADTSEEVTEDQDITFNSDYEYQVDYDYYDSADEDAALESERAQKEEAERSASNWKTFGIVLLVVFIIAGISRCGGQSLPDNCEYIQDERGGYTECT